MAARNTLSGPVELAHSNGNTVPVSLEDGQLIAHCGTAKRPERIPFSRPPRAVWSYRAGSDADLAAIRAAGYVLADGRTP